MLCKKSLTQLFNEDFGDGIDFDGLWSWTVWKKINNKFDLQKVNVSIDSLLFEMNKQWLSFLFHSYCNRQQREHTALLRLQCSRKSFIIAQIDFSMNYFLMRQREVQQGFFFRQQASLFTAHLTIDEEQQNVAIISDRLEHDTAFRILCTGNTPTVCQEEVCSSEKACQRNPCGIRM